MTKKDWRQAENQLAAFTRALSCPKCGKLCVDGCGGIRSFGLLTAEFSLFNHVKNNVNDPQAIRRNVENTFHRLFPGQAIEKRTPGEIAPQSPAAQGTGQAGKLYKQGCKTEYETEALWREWQERNQKPKTKKEGKSKP